MCIGVLVREGFKGAQGSWADAGIVGSCLGSYMACLVSCVWAYSCVFCCWCLHIYRLMVHKFQFVFSS